MQYKSGARASSGIRPLAGSSLEKEYKKKGAFAPSKSTDTYRDPNQCVFPVPFLVRTLRQENLHNL